MASSSSPRADEDPRCHAGLFGVARKPRTVWGAMSDAEQFDAFYSQTRDRLLVLAFALTGDLPASRGAVRDSFIAAWHHWAKVRRLHRQALPSAPGLSVR